MQVAVMSKNPGNSINGQAMIDNIPFVSRANAHEGHSASYAHQSTLPPEHSETSIISLNNDGKVKSPEPKLHHLELHQVTTSNSSRPVWSNQIRTAFSARSTVSYSTSACSCNKNNISNM